MKQNNKNSLLRTIHKLKHVVLRPSLNRESQEMLRISGRKNVVHSLRFGIKNFDLKVRVLHPLKISVEIFNNIDK